MEVALSSYKNILIEKNDIALKNHVYIIFISNFIFISNYFFPDFQANGCLVPWCTNSDLKPILCKDRFIIRSVKSERPAHFHISIRRITRKREKKSLKQKVDRARTVNSRLNAKPSSRMNKRTLTGNENFQVPKMKKWADRWSLQRKTDTKN